jgi:integrase
MATRTKGTVEERHWKGGRGYALRFYAYGERHYLTLGMESEGWTRGKAGEELDNILADVRRGIWVPTERKPKKKAKAVEGHATPRGDGVPLFGPFALEKLAAKKGTVEPRTYEYLEWGLGHLLPYFADWPVNEIDIEAVDGYTTHKVRESEARQRAIDRCKPQRGESGQVLRPLSATSINKTLDTLQWVLSFAVEYKHLESNPAEGKRRRLRVEQRRPVHLDTPDQIEALLDASLQLDREPYWRASDRRAIVSTLILAGPRAHELCHMLWRDVDLANGRIYVGRSKTQAGLREINMPPILRDDLATHKAHAYPSGPDDLVFPTMTGGRRDKDNVRNRVLKQAVDRADELLEARGHVPLPKGVTPHKLRHAFASTLIACGEDPASVMAQIGHTDPKFTLRVYTHMMRRSPEERARLKALVRGDQGSQAIPAAAEVAA